jgi:uncharacterized repeat protein (TIGR01451 family)
VRALGVFAVVSTALLLSLGPARAQTATTTQLITSGSPSAAGEDVIFTATVVPAMPGAQSPSGTVTFLDSGTPIGTGTLTPNGTSSVALFTTDMLPAGTLSVGTHTITTSYPGDSNFGGSSGGPLTQTVIKNDTKTLILASPNPSATNQPVAFDVVLSPVTPAVSKVFPTGTVNVFDNGNLIASPTLSSTGGNSQATFSTSFASTGNHNITMSYAGDANFNGNTNGTLTQVVNAPVAVDTSVTIAASLPTSVFGQSVTFTATITPASGTTAPGGTVTFSDGITTIGTATASQIGATNMSSASITTTTLPVGNLTITASYSGNSTFNPSSGTAPFTVQKQPVGVGLSSSAGSGITVSQLVTLQAFVNPAIPGTGPPTGTVTFTVNGNAVATQPVSSGQATFTTTLPQGSDTLAATYNGDNNFLGGVTSGTTTIQVLADPPSITKAFGTASINIGQVTTLSFSITNPNVSQLTGVSFTDSFPSGLVVATPNGLTGSCGGGSITATAGTSSTSLSGATLAAGGSCTFSVNVTATSAGAKNNVTQAVSNESGNRNSTATASIGVNAPSPPSISKLFGATSINIGQSTTLSFTITNPNASQLTGVGFTDAFPAGLVVATPSVVTGSCGGGTIAAGAGNSSASLSGATLAGGGSCTFSVNVSATTSGAKNNVTGAVTSTEGGAGNTGTASLTVNAPLAPAIAKAFGATSINVGQSTTLTFTITNPNASQLTGVGFTDTFPAGLLVATPNGLTGSCGGGSVAATAATGSASLSGGTIAANGSCTFSVNVTAASAGTKNNVTGAVTSIEGGTGNTANASITANLNSTSTTLTSSLNPSAPGQAVTFTATVHAASGTGMPTGTVTFKDGATTIGTGSVGTNGVATFTTSTLTTGSHNITAVYGGDTIFAGSTSAVLVQNVNNNSDSTKLRELQISATPIIAQGWGQAVSAAMDDAVTAGFGGNPQSLSPAGTGFTYYFNDDPPARPSAEPDQDSLRRYLASPNGSLASPDGKLAAANDKRFDDDFRGLGYAGGMPTKAPPPAAASSTPRDWLAWINVRGTDYFRSTFGNDLKGDQVDAFAGLTRRISANFVVGVFGGYEHFDYSSQAFNGVLKGNGWTAGAYLGWKLAPNLRFETGGAWSDLLANGVSGTASGHFLGTRWLVNGGLTGTYPWQQFVFEPSARVFALWEHENAYTDSLGTFQPARSFETGRASAGVKAIYPFAWTSGSVALSPYAGLYADYYFSKDDAQTAGLTTVPLLQGFSARATGGVAASFAGGATLGAGGEFGGIGSTTQIWTWTARGRIPF